MAWEKRVIWSEGMLLQPQHLQQQARYQESQLRNLIQMSNNMMWGIFSLDIDTSYLKTGKLCLNSACGILPDGSYFNIPEVDAKPVALEINESLIGQPVYLALNIRHHGNTEVQRQASDGKRYRYLIEEHDARDVSGHSSSNQIIEVSSLNLCLLTDQDDLSEFSCLPIVLIENVSSSGQVLLQDSFIAPTLNIKNIGYIASFLLELENLVVHRVAELAARISVAGKATTTEISDLLMLQTLNRYLPLVKHLAQTERISALDLYLHFSAIIGDLATFVSLEKTVNEHPIYQHNDLTPVFSVLIRQLRQSFSVVLERNSLNIPLVEQKYGIRVGIINDKTLFDTASFILAVSADKTPDDIIKYFPQQVKIGAVEQIKDLVNVQLPGILLNHLAAVPREIPYQRNFVYFELIASGKYWQALVKSSGIAIHIGTSFPGLTMELWAIRSDNG